MCENYATCRFIAMGAGQALCWVLYKISKFSNDATAKDVEVAIREMIEEIIDAVGDNFEKNIALWLNATSVGIPCSEDRGA